MAHIRDHTSTHSVTTANTESDFTHNVYINSLEEPLVVAWDYCALDATTSTTVLLTFDPVTLLQTELAEQRTQVAEVMAQNATLMAALSKGGGGGNSEGGRGGRSKDGDGSTVVGTKPRWKEKNLCPNCNKVVVYDPATCFSLEANKDKCLAGWGTKRGE